MSRMGDLHEMRLRACTGKDLPASAGVVVGLPADWH